MNPIKRHLAKIHEQNEETKKLAPREWAVMEKLTKYGSIFIIVSLVIVIPALMLKLVDEVTVGMLLAFGIGSIFGAAYALQWAAESRVKEVKQTSI